MRVQSLLSKCPLAKWNPSAPSLTTVFLVSDSIHISRKHETPEAFPSYPIIPARRHHSTFDWTSSPSLSSSLPITKRKPAINEILARLLLTLFQWNRLISKIIILNVSFSVAMDPQESEKKKHKFFFFSFVPEFLIIKLFLQKEYSRTFWECWEWQTRISLISLLWLPIYTWKAIRVKHS